MLEKTLESPSDCKEIQPVHPKGNQSWIFIRRTDTETEATILWSLEVKSQLIRKDPDAGKDWGQKDKETTEGEMVGCHHRLSGHEFVRILGDGEGQRNLTWCSPWDHKQSNTAEHLKDNNKVYSALVSRITVDSCIGCIYSLETMWD